MFIFLKQVTVAVCLIKNFNVGFKCENFKNYNVHLINNDSNYNVQMSKCSPLI